MEPVLVIVVNTVHPEVVILPSWMHIKLPSPAPSLSNPLLTITVGATLYGVGHVTLLVPVLLIGVMPVCVNHR